MIKREDVIFDPTDPRAVALEGKEVYASDNYDFRDAIKGVYSSHYVSREPFKCGLIWCAFIAPIPEPTYRPFKNAEEFKLFRDRWLLIRGGYTRIVSYDNYGCACSNGTIVSYETAFEQSTFEDGTPFGVKE